MEAVVFEIIMGIFFDAGMLAMVVHAAQHIGEDTGRVRFTAAVFAIGFFLGMIAKCVVGGSYTIFFRMLSSDGLCIFVDLCLLYL